MKSSGMAAVIVTTMESLELPRDLYWDGKAEPISPPNIELFSIYNNISDIWLNADVQTDDPTIISNDDIELNQCTDVVDLRVLEEGNLYTSFQSIDDGFLNCAQVHAPIHSTSYILPPPVDNSTITQLTPPSSPPQFLHSPAVDISIIPTQPISPTVPNFDDVFDQIPCVSTAQELSTKQFANITWSSLTDAIIPEVNPSICDDDELAREIQIVNDILKSAADELLDEHKPSSSLSAPLEEEDYGSSDDDTSSQHEKPNAGANTSLNKQQKKNKNTRTYDRGTDDRKIRKKEQNKNAATRYRQKKKLEMEGILVEEQGLLTRNAELRSEYAECKREAKYLKKLIREFYQHKRS